MLEFRSQNAAAMLIQRMLRMRKENVVMLRNYFHKGYHAPVPRSGLGHIASATRRSQFVFLPCGMFTLGCVLRIEELRT
jgi:hypothetical protein